MFGQYFDNELTDEQQKFAELIVKECADIALKSGNIANKSIEATAEAQRIYHKINERFEVEDTPVDAVDRILRTVRTRGQK